MAPNDPTSENPDLGSLPNWYTEIFPAGARNGFYEKFGDHSAVFVERDTHQLIISFDNLSDAGNPRYDREPWAAKFCRDNGWSHLGIFAQGPTWFRSKQLIALFDRLRNEGFFQRFKNVTLCGASMGGFAAMAFCDFAPGATVIAFSPQTTLDQTVVPWENRFQKGHDQDWSLPYSDAADQVSRAGRLYIIFDPMDANDRAHVDRLQCSNLVRLTAIGLGHKSAMTLRRMEQLKTVMAEGVSNQLTQARFQKITQGRKDLYIYRTTIEGYLAARGKHDVLKKFRRTFKTRRRLAKENTNG
ncbi:hypothetical protein [Parasulfitobacter algicola]|uniref:Phosphoadenosine phosphosulfate reductase n=1 Tax=Parasulfitobacter algicola TaxID=2614809 RepID=A0ABX2IPG3_9RHOB|nr:hypothetical protein [Sulfitobacter algicola]NSX54784.1 hypothetical protein [Sulfitobacter algicola]